MASDNQAASGGRLDSGQRVSVPQLHTCIRWHLILRYSELCNYFITCYNVMIIKCTMTVTCLNQPQTIPSPLPGSVDKLPSTKPAPGAEKAGDAVSRHGRSGRVWLFLRRPYCRLSFTRAPRDPAQGSLAGSTWYHVRILGRPPAPEEVWAASPRAPSGFSSRRRCCRRGASSSCPAVPLPWQPWGVSPERRSCDGHRVTFQPRRSSHTRQSAPGALCVCHLTS